MSVLFHNYSSLKILLFKCPLFISPKLKLLWYNSEMANIQYYGADFIFKFNGFSIESEFYNRTSNKGVIKNMKDTTQSNNIISGNTFMVQAGFFITRKIANSPETALKDKANLSGKIISISLVV